MSEEARLISVEAWLYTVKGKVTVHFVDGQTLEGELVKQDVLNFFLRVNDEPWLVPRSQVLFIQGRVGQPIEPDTISQKELEQPRVGAGLSLEELSAFDTADVAVSAPAVDAQPLEPAPAADVQPPEAAPVAPALEDEIVAEVFGVESSSGSATVIDEPAAEETEEGTGGMFVLTDSSELLEELARIAEPEDEEGETLVLNNLSEEDEHETTYVLATEISPVLARLTCTTGPHAGEEFELRSEVVTLGRATDNDIPLSLDKEISRRHARFQREGDKYVIYDQNSLNGVFINSRRVEESGVLHDGDIILVGVTNIEYREG